MACAAVYGDDTKLTLRMLMEGPLEAAGGVERTEHREEVRPWCQIVSLRLPTLSYTSWVTEASHFSVTQFSQTVKWQ